MTQEFKPFDEKDDGRRKILTSQHAEIRQCYKELRSMRAVAKKYGVDKRLIQFIVYPERYRALLDSRIEKKAWLLYYDRESHNESIRKLRAKKRKLNLIIKK